MSTLQLTHALISASALTVAFVGCLLMLIGTALPVRSARGNKMFSIGVMIVGCSIAFYLLWALASVITVVVMRS